MVKSFERLVSGSPEGTWRRRENWLTQFRANLTRQQRSTLTVTDSLQYRDWLMGSSDKPDQDLRCNEWDDSTTAFVELSPTYSSYKLEKRLTNYRLSNEQRGASCDGKENNEVFDPCGQSLKLGPDSFQRIREQVSDVSTSTKCCDSRVFQVHQVTQKSQDLDFFRRILEQAESASTYELWFGSLFLVKATFR